MEISASDEAARISARLRAASPPLFNGTLRIWGQWFGKPYDNIHRLIGSNAEDGVLSLSFQGGELLTVWSPSGLVAGSQEFQIADATRVRWEWFYYGRPQISENRFFLDYVKHGERVDITSNVSWYPPPPQMPISGPAAELLGFPVS